MNKEEICGLYKKHYPFWDELAPAEKEKFCGSTVLHKYGKAEIINRHSEQCTGLVFIKSGQMRIYILSEEGREVTLYKLGQGDICIFTALCVLDSITFDVVVEAETEMELLVVNSKVFNAVTQENIYVKCFSYQLASERFLEAMWTMQQVLFMRADKRLALLLLEEMKKQDSCEVRLTHEQLAKDMGSAREVVTRLLKYLANDGIVELSRGLVRVVNKSGLEKMVG